MSSSTSGTVLITGGAASGLEATCVQAMQAGARDGVVAADSSSAPVGSLVGTTRVLWPRVPGRAGPSPT